jgi:hypothetical protein
MSEGKQCEESECSKPVLARGLCGMHYRRIQRVGSLPNKQFSRNRWQGDRKLCTRCGEIKHRDEYNKLGNGRQAYCKPCQSASVGDSQQKRLRAERAALLKQQANRCLGCGLDGGPEAKDLVVDHDHACCSQRNRCGRCNRGLLCAKCNSALGMVGDSVETLHSLIRYLQRD